MLLLLLACADEKLPDDSGSSLAFDVDQRLDPADYPAPDGGLQLIGPDLVIPAYSDQTWCLAGTYHGDDVGVYTEITRQGAIGHHITVLETTANDADFPDGDVVECGNASQMPMTDLRPLLIPGDQVTNSSYALPEGMAVKFEDGTRYVVQVHYVNTTGDAVRVQDVVNLGFQAEDSVEIWAAAFAMALTEFTLPAGEDTSLSFDCGFEDSYNVLFVFGHMHEWGTSIQFDQVEGDTSSRVYEVDAWESTYRDAPPITRYEDGEFTFEPTRTYRTTCNWTNDTTADIGFPNEMCVVSGMLYPALVPQICSP